VTETGLTTALYLAYTGGAISLLGIVVGVALLLIGVGFIILALAVLPRGVARAEAVEAEAATT
jgi:hypothetical protein